MIITKTVWVNISGGAKEYYKNLGYEIPERKDKKGRIATPKGTKIEVNVEDLPDYSHASLEYQCDSCGKIFKTVRSDMTILGRTFEDETFCSGCATSLTHRKYEDKHYSDTKHGAERRGLVFDLTEKEFESITSKPCYYCGEYSDYNSNYNTKNGIDRLDSKKGYSRDNIVSCCKTCNIMKHKTSLENFMNKVALIYKKHIERNKRWIRNKKSL